MPDATELCSLTNIKTMLGLTTSAEETLLGLIKAAAEAWAKNYCGRDFLVTSYTEYYDGDHSNMLRTNQRPIVSVTSIYSDPARLFESASLIPASDLVGDAVSYRLGYVELLTYKYLRGLKSTKIVYSAGYSTVPTDLAMAVMLIICKQYKVISKKMFAETSQTAGDMTVTLSPDAFPQDAMKVIESYRRMDF